MKANEPFNVWNPKFKSMGTAFIKKNIKTATHYDKAGRFRFHNYYDVVGLEKTMHLILFAQHQAENEFLSKYRKELTINTSWEAGYNTKLDFLRKKANLICLALSSFSANQLDLNQDVSVSVEKMAKKAHQYLQDDSETDVLVIEKDTSLLGIKLAKAQTISKLFDRYYTNIQDGMRAHYENYKLIMKLRKEADMGSYTPSIELQHIIPIMKGRI